MSSDPSGRRDAAGSGRRGADGVGAELAADLETLRVKRRPDPRAPDRPRRRWPWLVALGVLAALAIAGFAAQRLLRPVEIELVAVTLRELGSPPVLLTASGYIEARRQITVSSKAQGKIVEMPIEENQRVKAGDLIARLENDEQRASLALAEAEYADAAARAAAQAGAARARQRVAGRSSTARRPPSRSRARGATSRACCSRTPCCARRSTAP